MAVVAEGVVVNARGAVDKVIVFAFIALFFEIGIVSLAFFRTCDLPGCVAAELLVSRALQAVGIVLNTRRSHATDEFAHLVRSSTDAIGHDLATAQGTTFDEDVEFLLGVGTAEGRVLRQLIARGGHGCEVT